MSELPSRPTDEALRKLREIYDDAPARRNITDSILSEGTAYTRIDQKTEAQRLEWIFVKAGWVSPTVTEGIKMLHGDGYLVRCEVITDEDYYVELIADLGFEKGQIIRSEKKSPW